MSDGMGNIGKAGQPMEWSTDHTKSDEKVADSKFSGRKAGRKRKSDTFLKREAAKSRKLERPTTSLSERSAQKTAVRSHMRIDTDKYDINQICLDYRSKILSAKSFVEVKGFKSELEDIMEVHQELFTDDQLESLSTLIEEQEKDSLQLDIDDAKDIDKLPRLKAHIESLKYNSPQKNFSDLDIEIGDKFTELFMAKMERTETLEQLRHLHIQLEEMRDELELGYQYPPHLKKNLAKTTEQVVGFELSDVQNPEELLGIPEMIEIMGNPDIKRELADSLYDKVSENSTEWAESEDFEKVTRELISTYERMRPEVDDESELEEINEKTTELSKLLPPPNMENFSDKIRNTASITELHLLRNHLRSQIDHYDEDSYKEVKDMIYQRLGELMLTQYHYADNMVDLVENAEDILTTFSNKTSQGEMIAKQMLTENPLLNDILESKSEFTQQELKTVRRLLRTIRNSINEE